MRAIIMAGGHGKRLFPYTLVLPKPLVPVGEYPILEVVIRQLAHCGFDHVTIAVGYHAELIMAVMGDGSKLGINIDYSYENKPLNTVGPLRLIKELNDTFLVMNGDLLTDINYFDLFQTHKRNHAIATVATYKRHIKLPLGVVSYNQDHYMTNFLEKPEFDYDVSMGIYIFEPRILDFIPYDEPFGFDQLMEKLLQNNERVSVYPFDGNWLDMGTMDDLNVAIEEFENNRERYLLNG